MKYTARVVNASNMIEVITLAASDESDARRQLGIQARNLLSLQSSEKKSKGTGWRKRFSLTLFSQELLTLLVAGLTLKDSLEALAEKADDNDTREVLVSITSRLQQGMRFSQTLSVLPSAFPPLYIGLIQAAENTGDLPVSLGRFVEYQERLDVVRNKILSASIYPVILMIVGGMVTLFLLGYVVPKFSAIYEGTGRELPWLSVLMLRLGYEISRHGLFIALIGCAVGGGLFLILRRALRDAGASALLARLPGLRRRVAHYRLSRLYLTLGMLLEGGIPILAAMKTSEGIMSGPGKTSLHAAGELISQGQPLSATFHKLGLTTPISLRMIAVGERSGKLGQMLSRAAAFYDADTARFIERFTRIFEPALMALIGLIVGLIVVLLYMPIFDLAGSIQ